MPDYPKRRSGADGRKVIVISSSFNQCTEVLTIYSLKLQRVFCFDNFSDNLKGVQIAFIGSSISFINS